MGAAEECKHVLSTLNTAHCFIESLHEGVDLSANVSRARIDMLITQLFPEYIGPISEALTQAGLTASNVHKVFGLPQYRKKQNQSIFRLGDCLWWNGKNAQAATSYPRSSA